ncbi:extensin family protein [Mesorhizobium sp. J428]|uniref:extensin-like domain-containing protein n=1 Tax=Mesorhizobium sp. J428 TaxID=2898440 RepID=UPI0021511049|nr:extensin family protein [Mesorhizobium sp. J428]MCR5858763.1 extensin family protein [Mesorhizobium sp. J428]
MSAALFALAVIVAVPAAKGAEDVPMPQPRPERPGDPDGASPRDGEAEKGVAGEKGAGDETGLPDAGEAPKPEPRPEQAGEVKEEDQPPADAGKAEPSPKPEARSDRAGKDEVPTDAGEAKPSLMPPPRPAEMPAEETACRARLKELGVAFEERPQLADAAGCSVPWPIAVSALSKEVALAPQAVMNCATAQRAAEFSRDQIEPKASAILGSDLTSIRQDSAYVCRPRNGTTKLSEHAFGNALDIGAFTLKDGRTVEVGKVSKRQEGEFMLAVRLAACGPFTTVLGPGSDADHALHFHFDLATRRKGSAFCQ